MSDLVNEIGGLSSFLNVHFCENDKFNLLGSFLLNENVKKAISGVNLSIFCTG